MYYAQYNENENTAYTFRGKYCVAEYNFNNGVFQEHDMLSEQEQDYLLELMEQCKKEYNHEYY